MKGFWVFHGSRLQIDLFAGGLCPELYQWTTVPIERSLCISPAVNIPRFESESKCRSHHRAAEYTIRRCRPLISRSGPPSIASKNPLKTSSPFPNLLTNHSRLFFDRLPKSPLNLPSNLSLDLLESHIFNSVHGLLFPHIVENNFAVLAPELGEDG